MTTLKKPWQIGEQQLAVNDQNGDLLLVLSFSSDPQDASRKRLRLAPPVRADGGAAGPQAIEITFDAGGNVVETYYQDMRLKPWQRGVEPPVEPKTPPEGAAEVQEEIPGSAPVETAQPAPVGVASKPKVKAQVPIS